MASGSDDSEFPPAEDPASNSRARHFSSLVPASHDPRCSWYYTDHEFPASVAQLNIWAYNPNETAKPFTLKDSISTGHHANIFSVKFMPHSDDRRVVSCAGDSEVRVFDLEYSERMQNGSGNAFTASTRSRRFSDFFPNARWLSDANTNAKVYRSHADRAKRIVTESSPHLFLTCSEDGEVGLLSRCGAAIND